MVVFPCFCFCCSRFLCLLCACVCVRFLTTSIRNNSFSPHADTQCRAASLARLTRCGWVGHSVPNDGDLSPVWLSSTRLYFHQSAHRLTCSAMLRTVVTGSCRNMTVAPLIYSVYKTMLSSPLGRLGPLYTLRRRGFGFLHFVLFCGR